MAQTKRSDPRPVELGDATVAALAAALAGGGASGPTAVKAVPLEPKGYQQILAATLAAVTSLTVPDGAQYAIIQNNGTAGIRYRDDGLDPTAAIGQVLPNGEELFYEGDLSALKVIQAAAGAILDVAYYA